MTDADVRLARVSKNYGPIVAVDDLSLEINRGEFFSLLGPSGCGKTTTLRMIGGFVDPTSGTVHLGDTDVTSVPPYRRDVNTVFQSYALFPHLSVFDNIAFGLKRRRTQPAEIKRRVQEMLELVDLGGFDKRRATQLSSGQQQRVALARALVNEPRVLLLDEPLGALDLSLRKQVRLEMKRIQRETGITFLAVTHDQDEAMTMSNRIAVMREGRIEQIGAPEDVYEHPETDFVAGFLGASNLLDGRIGERGEDFASVTLDDGTILRVPVIAVDPTRPGVRIGVRPEKIRVESDMTSLIPAAWNVITGMVRETTFVGGSHQFAVRIAGGLTMTVYAQNRGLAKDVPHLGDEVRLIWRPEHTFVVEATGAPEVSGVAVAEPAPEPDPENEPEPSSGDE